MNALSILCRAPVSETLEFVLDDIARHGQPRLSLLKGLGWWCRVEMNVSIEGANYKIESEYRHVTPLEAAIECRSRMQSAIAQRGGV